MVVGPADFGNYQTVVQLKRRIVFQHDVDTVGSLADEDISAGYRSRKDFFAFFQHKRFAAKSFKQASYQG